MIHPAGDRSAPIDRAFIGYQNPAALFQSTYGSIITG
jgi:hypothetical protein